MKTLTMRVTLVLKRAREILAVWLLTIVFGASHRVGAASVQYGYDALYRLHRTNR